MSKKKVTSSDMKITEAPYYFVRPLKSSRKTRKKKVRLSADKTFFEYQGDFQIDQLFTIKQVLTKSWQFNMEVHQIFVNFKQTYDSTDH